MMPAARASVQRAVAKPVPAGLPRVACANVRNREARPRSRLIHVSMAGRDRR
jgi:hypothetical protein